MTKLLEAVSTLKLEAIDKEFTVYGSIDEPLFLAKEVAEWIDYAKTSKGAYDVSSMLKTVDEDEKTVRKLFVSSKTRDMWFLTDDGVYEVLMLSRKPIAKAVKKEIKTILKQLRKEGVVVSDNATTEQKLYNYDLLDVTFSKIGVEHFADEYKACIEYHVKNKTRLNYEKSSKNRRSDKKLTVAQSKIKIMNKILSIAKQREQQYRVNFSWELKSLISDVVKQISLDIKEVKHNQTRGKLSQAKKAI